MSNLESTRRPDLAALKIEREEEHPVRRRSFGKVAGRLVALAVGIALLFFVWQQLIAPRTYTRVELLTVHPTVQQTSLALLTASGYLVAEKQADVTAKIPGRVSRILVDVGAKVTAGQPLVTLESEDLIAQMNEAQATYLEASREYNRQKTLWNEGVSSRSLLDSAEAQLQVSRARLERTRISLKDNVVRSPFSGTVIARNVEIGEMVSSLAMGQPSGGSTAMYTITDLSSLELHADVNEANVGQLRPGQPAEVSVDAYPKEKWRGRLRQIVPTANRAKGVVQVKVSILDPSDRLLPEMSASVSFLQKERTEADLRETPKIWIPASAVVQSSSGARVVTVTEEQSVVTRPVTLGARRDNRVEVLSGLADGDKIVTNNAGSYKENQRVRVPETK